MGLKTSGSFADTWVMPRVRGFGGVLGSGLSMVAAGVTALIFVSVLLAFHGWPGDVSSNTAPPVVTVAAAVAPPVPTVVIGRPALTRAAGAATTAPVGRARLRNGAPSTSAPTFSDLSRAGAPQPPTAKGTTPGQPSECTGTLVAGQCVNVPAVAVPSQVSQVIDQVQQPSLQQQVQTGVQNTTKTVGGVIGGVVSTVSKALGR